MEVVARIAQHHTAVAFQSCGIAKPLVLQTYPVGVVLYAVGRHLVIGIVDERQICAVEESVVLATDLRRHSQLLIVATAEHLHGPFKGAGGDVVGIQVQHTANGVRAIEQGGRSFDDLGTVDTELVDFKSMVVAPLLSLMLHAVLGHRHTIKAQSTNGGLRLSRAYRHGLHAGNAL